MTVWTRGAGWRAGFVASLLSVLLLGGAAVADTEANTEANREAQASELYVLGQTEDHRTLALAEAETLRARDFKFRCGAAQGGGPELWILFDPEHASQELRNSLASAAAPEGAYRHHLSRLGKTAHYGYDVEIRLRRGFSDPRYYGQDQFLSQFGPDGQVAYYGVAIDDLKIAVGGGNRRVQAMFEPFLQALAESSRITVSVKQQGSDEPLLLREFLMDTEPAEIARNSKSAQAFLDACPDLIPAAWRNSPLGLIR